MANVLTFVHSVLPYGMLLTTLFRACYLDLESESDIKVSKPSYVIDHACIARLGYKYDGRQEIKNVAHALAVVDVETDEESKMDIPPSSPTVPPSPPPAPSTTTGLFAPPDWYQRLS